MDELKNQIITTIVILATCGWAFALDFISAIPKNIAVIISVGLVFLCIWRLGNLIIKYLIDRKKQQFAEEYTGRMNMINRPKFVPKNRTVPWRVVCPYCNHVWSSDTVQPTPEVFTAEWLSDALIEFNPTVNDKAWSNIRITLCGKCGKFFYSETET